MPTPIPEEPTQPAAAIPAWAPPLVSLALFATGLLLILEIIRPSRDLAIDGPTAMVCWGLGILLPALTIRRRKTTPLNIAALTLNALALIAVATLLFLLRNPIRLF